MYGIQLTVRSTVLGHEAKYWYEPWSRLWQDWPIYPVSEGTATDHIRELDRLLRPLRMAGLTVVLEVVKED